MAEYRIRVAVETAQAERGLARVDAGLRGTGVAAVGANRGVGQLATGFRAMQAAIAALGVGIVVRQVYQLGAAAVQASIQLQQIENSLRFATGGAEAAGDAYGFVRAEAERLGLDLATSAKQFGALSAAARGTELEGQATREIFTAIAEASTVMGLSAEQSAGALNAIQQMISKGNVSAEELRQQLGERLPGAFQMAARAMGVTTEELNKLLDRGEVTATELIPALAVELRNAFGSDVARASEGTLQKFNRLHTAIFDLKVAAGEALAPAVGELAQALSRLASNEEAQETLTAIASAAGRLIESWSLQLERLLDVIEMYQRFTSQVQETAEGMRSFGSTVMEHATRHNPALAAALVLVAHRFDEMNKAAEGEDKKPIYVRMTPRFVAPEAETLDDAIDAHWKQYVAGIKEAEQAAERYSEAVADLSAKVAQETREEQFLLAALRRGEAEFRRAELVVAAYNGALVDGKLQLDLFDDALRLEGLKVQRENLEKLNENLKDLKDSAEEAGEAYREFVEAGLGLGAARPTGIELRPEEERLTGPLGGMTEKELEAFLATISIVDQEHLKVIDRQGTILENLEEWQGAAYIIADAMYDIDEALANVVASAGDFLGAMQNIGQEGGKVTALIAGLDFAKAIGQAVTGPNNYGAEGALYGAIIGGIIGAFAGGQVQAGVAIGGAAGGALGSFISKGVDEFLGSVSEAEGRAITRLSRFGNSLSQIGKIFLDSISRGIDEAVGLLGGELANLPQLEVKIRDGVYTVFSNGITARFQSMQEAVDFAILQALREGEITGLSDEVRAALENSTAESFAAMAQDLDFAKWAEGLPEIGEAATETARLLDTAIDGFRSAMRKAADLGIDPGKIAQDFARNLTAIRNGILGIVETDEERIRREAEAFNRELQIIQAEQLAKKAELTIQEQMLRSQVAFIEAHGQLIGTRIALDGELLRGESNMLEAKLAMLSAVQQALAAVDLVLAGLPDLISNADIEKAIRRARGDGGAAQRAEGRESIREEVAGWGLSDVSAALHEASQFTEQFEERIRDLGFSAEETATLLAEAAEEEARRAEQVRNDVRQTYYDAIAQAQGLSEIWGVLDRFRDLRQAVLDAGLSAEETAERMRGIDWAEDVELQRIEIGIVDRLFGYLEGEEDWAERSLEFARMKVELEFGIMQAQLQLLGVFEEYIDIFNAAREAALADLELPNIEPPARNVRNHFEDAARAAAEIAENFARAKQSVAEFLNEVLVGEFGGTSPIGGVLEAQRQLDEVIRQAMTGNIGAIENFDDYASTLLRLARDAYGSSPEFQAIRDYVLASGRDILGLQQGREGNLIFDERFYAVAESQLSEQKRMADTMARIERELSRRGGSIVNGQAA